MQKYSIPMRVLHWIIAILIFGVLGLGIFMTPYNLDAPEYSDNLYYWHKSFGLLALMLIVVRLIVRLRSNVPPLPDSLPKHEIIASHVVHKLLYVMMFLLPVLGYIQSSTYEYSSGVHFFFFDLPELLPDNKQLFELTNFAHRICGYGLLALISLHVLGALKHRFFDREENDVLKRML